VLVDGPGGIGKTRLLQKIGEEYSSVSSLVVSNLLDLYEPGLRVPLLWEYRVAQQIERAGAFSRFWAEYRELLELELRGVSTETLSRTRDRVDEAFVQGFNRVAVERRIVLLLDTLEDAQSVGALWPHLLGLMTKLSNVAWIVAGRRCDEVRPEVEARVGSQNVHWLHLKEFDKGAADEYFDEYFRRPSVIALDPEMREKIRLLTGGRPILMALAIAWLENELPLPEIEAKSVGELQLMSGQHLQELKEEVRRALVRHLLAFENTVDRVILNMAWAERRFNTDIINHLMGPVETDVLQRLSALPFVKVRPGENYVLHDEMRDMTVEYTWPKVDPDGTLRKKIDQMMVNYYDREIQRLEARVNELEHMRKDAREAGDARGELEAFEELGEQGLQRDVLEAEQLFYALRADLKRGVEQFVKVYEQATARSQMSFRAMLWEEMQRFEARFGETREFRVGIRGATYLLDAGDAAAARSKGIQVLEQFAGTDDERIEALVHLGNCSLRLGQPLEARDYYSQARDLCNKDALMGWLAVVENGLGLAYRSIGDWDEAATHYEESVRACEEFDSPSHHLASALNNYAYVLGLRGIYGQALALCDQALNLRKDLALWRSVGTSYSTMGEIYRYQERYEDAFKCYEQALRILEEQDNRSWLAVVYQEWAIAKTYTGERDEAWTSIQRALELCERYNVRALPWALNRAGRIARARGQYDQSERFLRRGIEEAEKTGDVWFYLATMVELMESRYAHLKEKGGDIQELAEESGELAVRINEYEGKGYGFRDLFGRTRRMLGHLRIASGYYGSHGLHRLPDELAELGKRIEGLEPEEAIRWCDELRGSWIQEQGSVALMGFCAMNKRKAQQRRDRGAEAVQ
jgi:tetratricopeptide (TPR) repeat protein